MQIFAHRGASGDYPENTLLAFEQAIAQGADGIELDIHQADGELWIVHDFVLQGTTSGSGKVADKSQAYLQSLNAGLAEKVPTLSQALALIAGRCQVNIEVKALAQTELLTQLLDSLCQEGIFQREQFLISSFNHQTLKQIQASAPQYQYAALLASLPIDNAAVAQQLAVQGVNIDNHLVTQAFVKDAHHRGCRVGVYTVDDPQQLQQLAEWGVDWVFCNFPLRAKEVLA